MFTTSNQHLQTLVHQGPARAKLGMGTSKSKEKSATSKAASDAAVPALSNGSVISYS